MSPVQEAKGAQANRVFRSVAKLAVALALILPLAEATRAQSSSAPGREAPASATYRFDIPGQSLLAALGEFTAVTRISVMRPDDRPLDGDAPPVSGDMSADQALSILLSGSGLRFRYNGERTVVLEPSGAADVTADDGVLSLGPVEVTAPVAGSSNPEDRAYTTAGSSDYLDQDTIERDRGMSVGDIFRDTTGVLVAENRNSGGLNVNIRGMQGQGRVPVLVDGARQETTVYRGYAGVTSRSYIDPDLIGRIDIDKGPTMSPQGTGATGGLVSMHTIGVDDIVKPGETWGVRVRGSLLGNNSGSPAEPGTAAGYAVAQGGNAFGGPSSYRIDCTPGSTLCSGEHDIANVYGPDETLDRPDGVDLQGRAASLVTAWRLPAVDLVTAYAHRQQGNYYTGKNGPTPSLDLSEQYDRGFYTEVRPKVDGASRFRGEERIVNSNYASDSMLLKASLYPGSSHELELSYLQYESEYGELMPSQLLWFGRVNQTEDSTVTVDTYTGRYQWQPGGRGWADLELRFWHTDSESLNNSYSEELAELVGGVPDTERYRRWGSDLTNTMRFAALGDLQIEYGVAWQRERVRPVDGDITARSPMRDGERLEESVFTALKWNVLPRLTLDAGIRYTRYHSEDNKPVYIQDETSPFCRDRNEDGNCDDVFIDSRGSGQAPMISLLWEPRDGMQLYAQYTEALRMPSLFETTAGFSVAATPGTVLKPEHARNREVGFNWLRGGSDNDSVLRFKAAYFENRTEDYLTRTIPNAWEDTSAGQNAGFFRMRNIESVEFQGAELSLEYDAGRLFAKVAGTHYRDIELCHAGSYRRQRCTDYGIATSYVNNMIPPNWQANATLGGRFFSRRLELGVRATWMGERNRVPEYNNQTETALAFAQPIPWHDYTLIDVFLSWQPSEAINVAFNVDNITDQYYLDALSLGMVPAPGRTAMLNTVFHF